ncbi:MAG: M14 family zinc carboxypeptidase [Actinomycetota bacterium]
MRTRALLLFLTALLISPRFLASTAVAAPVKCAEDDVTPDGRVFPEPRNSATYLRFDEFQCAIKFLESQYPDLIEVTTIGTSQGGYPVYNILLTNEKVTQKKRKLLVVSSIHGNEIGAREGAARCIEDMVDERFLGDEGWVKKTLDRYVVHWLFPNPDGWVNGDLTGSKGAGSLWTRGNDNGLDLNRQFPVKGYIYRGNETYSQPEAHRVVEALFDTPKERRGWYLATDNHGQGGDTYLAAGLQIVGEFDYQKSQALARFADGITERMRDYDVHNALAEFNARTGQDMGAYHWGTLYDMLGYSASGSLIDYYNTESLTDGWGFATELTAGFGANTATHGQMLNQIYVDSIRAINYTMFQQAVYPKRFTFKVGSKAAYVFDPEVIRHDDENGPGFTDKAARPKAPQQPYRVTRMKFFADLNEYASRRLAKLRVAGVLSGKEDLDDYESLILANDPMPEGSSKAAWYSMLGEWVRAGGNLILTDAALTALADLKVIDREAIIVEKQYVGFVGEFVDRSHPLNEGLRGVASQTYDTVPIGYAFGPEGNNAPNWKVDRAAWEEAGGYTAGTNGDDQTIYGEVEVGQGRIRILGALLPDPTEKFYHPYGLQNYAVVYTGYTLLENMLK